MTTYDMHTARCACHVFVINAKNMEQKAKKADDSACVYVKTAMYTLGMHTYRPTERGQEIAVDSGLDRLAERILDSNESLHPLLYDIIDRLCWAGPSEVQRKNAIAEAAAYARDDDELRTLHRGLSLEAGVQNWRYLGGYADQTLFPHRRTEEFTPSTEEDQLAVSGVVGVLMKNYKSRYPILARSRAAEYGFGNHMEACAFAGAYIIGQILDDEHRRFTSAEPGFEIEKGNTTNRVIVGGTRRGDFRIGLTKSLNDGAISPTGDMVDFAPHEAFWVSGYHSVEPYITASMITNEYLAGGRAAALRLLSGFSEKLRELANDDGAIDFRSGAFADYGGSGDTEFCLSQLRFLLDNPDAQERLIQREKLYSYPYLPQSSTLFEIEPIADGIRFQNRSENDGEPELGIDVSKEHFSDLFEALIIQAQEGLGRTSPMQHVEVLKYAADLLEP